MASRKLSAEERRELLALLKARFEKTRARHEGIDWADVAARLEKNAGKVWSLHETEPTGGEPDVIGRDEATGELVFIDCAAESPKGRRSVCYDAEALAARKEHKPADSAMNMAQAMGIELLSEGEHRNLQQLGAFRHEDVELGEDAGPYPETRRRAVLRPSLRHRLRVSQRRGVVLRRTGVPGAS